MDGAAIEAGDVTPCAGAGAPFAKDPEETVPEHGAIQRRSRRRLYPGAAVNCASRSSGKKKPAVDREAEESTAGSVPEGMGPAG